MRLALIIEGLNPRGGGAERNCVELSRRLTERGHDVTILCGAKWNDPDAAVPNVTIEAGPTGKVRNALRLWRFHNWVDTRLTQENFEASWCFSTAAAADVLQPLGGSVRETQARNVTMRPDAGARLLKRATQLITPKQVMLRRLEKRTLAHPRVKYVAALSDYVHRMFTELGVPEDKLRIIPNAVDLTPPTPAQRRAWRKRIRDALHIPEDATVYLFSAYNPKLKGVDPLLAALARLVEDGTSAVLLLAGGVGYREVAIGADLGIRDHLRFIRWTQQMPALYAAADVTVHPTFYDPSSRIVIESLISGTPAIASVHDGSSDRVKLSDDQKCGRICTPEDVGSIVAAMRDLADPKERKRCRDATKGLVDELSIERHVDQVEALLAEVAEQSHT